MTGIIGEQHIARRRKPPFLYNTLKRKAAARGSEARFSEAGYVSDFIRQVKQKPSRGRRPAAFRFGKPLSALFKFNFNFNKKPGRHQTAPRRNPRPASRSAGFSFPVPSIGTFAVVAGTLGISLLVLNWEGAPPALAAVWDVPKSAAPMPGPDEEVRRNLASYVGFPALNAQAENSGGETIEMEGGDIPLDLTETFEWTAYQVQKGDSVSQIAAKFALSMDAVIASNDIRNVRRLREGEVLRIPNMDGIPYTIKKGDSLEKIAKSMGVPLEVILDANDIRTDVIQQGGTLFIPGARMAPEALKLALGDLFTYPIRGRVTSQFGWRISPVTGERHFHAALDLAGSIGTPVKAAIDGTVSTVGSNYTFGRYIILSHDNGYQTMYAHLSAVSVKQGERVNQGGKIGEVGNTGLTTGPHLHFAVYKNGRAINPLELMN
jgi:murein DD-endopeptidase MepM/ murein hydrolase activator NlpD